MLVLVASWIVLELAAYATQKLGIVPWVGLHIAFLVVFSGLLVGMHRMALDAIDGAPPSLRRLPESIGRGPTMLVAATIHGLGIAAGLALFVVPGIYISSRYSLLPLGVADKRESVSGAIRKAGALTRGRWWPVFNIQLVLLALNACGAALLGVGLLISFPISLLAMASFYRSLQHRL